MPRATRKEVSDRKREAQPACKARGYPDALRALAAHGPRAAAAPDTAAVAQRARHRDIDSTHGAVVLRRSGDGSQLAACELAERCVDQRARRQIEADGD